MLRRAARSTFPCRRFISNSAFAGKSVVVTGASNGIGQAIAAAFAQSGAAVTLLDIQPSSCAAEPSHRTQFVHADVARESDVQSAMERAGAWAGGVDVLVNCAAKFVFGEVTSVSSEDWDSALHTNVKGYALCMKHAIPLMKVRGRGAIVNVSSISAFLGQPGFVPYSTTKAAVLQMTRNVATDCGRYGIRVNAVCPGPILTDATQRHADKTGTTVDKLVEDMKSHLILPRMGRPMEVAKAVLFLASDDASYITGASLMVRHSTEWNATVIACGRR